MISARAAMRPQVLQRVSFQKAATACLLGAGAAMVGVVTAIFGPVALLATFTAAAFLSPRVGRLALTALILLIPWVNPPLAGVGTGRFYVGHVLVLTAVVSALGVLLLRDFRLRYLALFGVAGLYAVVVGVTRVGTDLDTLGWVYRPLQPFLLTAAVALLVAGQNAARWLRYAAIGGIVGCGLAVLYASIPSIDPFALTRPADLPYVSSIGAFVRATGAFVYPNNLGSFAAYAATLSLATLILDRPQMNRILSGLLLVLAVTALALSASRAAAFGLLLATAFLVLRARVGRRVAFVGAFMLVVAAVIVLFKTSPGAGAVLDERIETRAISFFYRQQNWQYGLERFQESPLVGTGVEQSRLDGSWFLYLYTGGIVGVGLLAVLGMYLWLPNISRRAPYPELGAALLIAVSSSALFQDTLGQTLSSWFPSIILGICLAHRTEPVESLTGATGAWNVRQTL